MVTARDVYSPGDKLGEWTVLEIRPGRKWLMECKCGYQAEVYYDNLVRGVSKSCYPCSMAARSGENNSAWKGIGQVPGKRWSRLLRGAESRGLEVTIDFPYIVTLLERQEYRCALTGLDIDGETGSVDRIDSSLGYVEGNLQWVTKEINLMKNNINEERFKELCALVAAYER